MSDTHTLVLLRHGQSTWNLEKIFTGWTAVPLSDHGRSEASVAGTVMADEGMSFDVVHTSVLRRAIDTASIALDAMDLAWIPVSRHWRLNERHYGDLQGLNKLETTERFGKEQVHEWRRSYATPPPPLDRSDPRHPSHEKAYRDLPSELLPSGECLRDVIDRMLPYWYDRIVPDLVANRSVLVVAHGNSLRGVVKHLDGVPDEEISDVNIPTGVPLRYILDRNLKVIEKGYLGDAESIKSATDAVAAQAG
jgi:2,3-bisphosphoglycerate-dependent phosphoglycerate mutase